MNNRYVIYDSKTWKFIGSVDHSSGIAKGREFAYEFELYEAINFINQRTHPSDFEIRKAVENV